MGGMIPRSNLAPNNRKDVPLEELLSIEFAPYINSYKADETPSIPVYQSRGRGQQGESVSGGPKTKRHNIRKGPMR
jgi:hypothetical protein